MKKNKTIKPIFKNTDGKENKSIRFFSKDLNKAKDLNLNVQEICRQALSLAISKAES